MKRNTIIAVLILIPVCAFSQPDSEILFKRIDAFMQQYVRNGLVAYSALKKQPQELSSLVESIAKFNLKAEIGGDVEKAFWINVYNVLVIDQVVENYPLESPQNVAGFFDRRKQLVAGEKLTLNEIENIRLRKPFKDGRIHFVLVCAAHGCPPLHNRAFLPDQLNTQLEDLSRKAINNPAFIRVNKASKEVSISKIFTWYALDFDKNVIQYLNRFREQPIPADYKVSYYDYDWRLNAFNEPDQETPESAGQENNLQAFTPSTLLHTGGMEIKIFNNLYTQTAFFNDSGHKTDLSKRATFFTMISSFLYGMNSTINIGFDAWFKSVRNEQIPASPFSLFKFSSNGDSRSALTAISPKIKIAPFTQLPNLSLQNTIFIPLGSDFESQPFLDYNDVQWWTQFFFDKSLSNKILAYIEHGWLFRFDEESVVFRSPVKLFLNYAPSTRWTFYLPLELTPSWDGLRWSTYYFQTGLGLKYQILPNLELESLLTSFARGKQEGAGMTYNLGFRFIK